MAGIVICVVAALAQLACAADTVSANAGVVANAAQEQGETGPAHEAAAAVVKGTGGSDTYSVDCGQTDDDGQAFCYVDGATYIGWRTYHGFCHVCHAQDAVGSTFAPSLVDRMKSVDYDLFIERTANGYTGQVGVMPPWKDNPNVSKRYKELYAYLKARADGALRPGRPKKKPAG